MESRKLLDKAISIAVAAHYGQKSKDGLPYIMHPLHLMMQLDTEDQELAMIAVMHDVIEDSDFSFDDLKKAGFSRRVVKAIDRLTHREEDLYSEYIERIKESEDAVKIKLLDLKHNMDVSRLRFISDKDSKRLKKYHSAYAELMAHLTPPTEG